MRRTVLCVLALAIAATLVACGPDAPPAAERPARADLDTPASAVRSYLDWVSYAYRVADAQPAAPTMTPSELVRVDAYIERNRQENRGIEQELVSFKTRARSGDDRRATLSATERWRYRYFTLQPLEYSSEQLSASYETTYTLVSTDGGWVVDDIEVRPVGEVE